jgi:hypothetical protein
MDSNLLWYRDEQRMLTVLYLQMRQPGPKRKDDRSVLSGIMHVLKIGRR